MEKYPIEVKSIEELVKEANELLRMHQGMSIEMTIEEEMEDDADGGYFEDD